MINKSIATGCFPSQLKQAKVLPIFKGGTNSDPSNHRPIFILPTISKIFEKTKTKKTQIKLIDSWMKCIDSGDMVGALFLDFQRAFGLIDHAILMKKLSIYKFSPSALQWFNSYLNNRQQVIESDKGLTDFSWVRSGVPQGSILGSTLFLIFINGLPLCFEHCKSDLYTDDATVHDTGKNVSNVKHNLLCDLENAIDCCFFFV